MLTYSSSARGKSTKNSTFNEDICSFEIEMSKNIFIHEIKLIGAATKYFQLDLASVAFIFYWSMHDAHEKGKTSGAPQYPNYAWPKQNQRNY